jgi:hypothetical protein
MEMVSLRIAKEALEKEPSVVCQAGEAPASGGAPRVKEREGGMLDGPPVSSW